MTLKKPLTIHVAAQESQDDTAYTDDKLKTFDIKKIRHAAGI